MFDSNGNFLRSFGHRGENPGEFYDPNGIAIDKDRNIFVSEWGNDRVQIFSWEGRYLGSFGGMGSLDSQLKCPRGLSLDSTGNITVTDTGNKQIKIITPDAKFVVKIGGQDCFNVPFHWVVSKFLTGRDIFSTSSVRRGKGTGSSIIHIFVSNSDKASFGL